MATLRPFYAGDKVSAKQFNELVCAIECLCSQMKNLQRDQRTSSFQNVVVQRRYVPRTQTESSFNAVKPLATKQETEIFYLCRESAEREYLPFSIVHTPDESAYYLLGGSISDGKDLLTYEARCLDLTECGATYQTVWLSSCATGTVYCTPAIRGGTKLLHGGQAVHQGSGVVERDCFCGYGVVKQSKDCLSDVYVSQFPFHVYKEGIDIYSGGYNSNGSVVAGQLDFLNATKIADISSTDIGFPAQEALYFATARDDGSISRGYWYARGSYNCAENVWHTGRPLFCSQLLRYSFCLCANYCTPDYVRISGRFQAWSYSWTMAVPVAYSAINCADGLTCVRTLEQEVLVAPSTMFTQFCVNIKINCAGVSGITEMAQLDATGRDPAYRELSPVETCVPRCAYWVCLPVAIPENCFGFPTCSVDNS